MLSEAQKISTEPVVGSRWRFRAPVSVGAALILLLSIVFIWHAQQTARLLMAWYSALPLRDYWQNLAAYPRMNITSFWRQQNEHRVVFPELIFAVDTLLFRGRMILPLGVSVASYLGVLCALVWAAYSERTMPSPQREIGLLLAGSLMLWQGCAVVLANPFQLTFTLMQFAVSLSFVFLVKLKETNKTAFAWSAAAAALVATYSLASGLLLWPLLIGGALLLGVRRGQLVLLACIGAVGVGLYFVGYQFRPSAGKATAFIGFLLSYLGMPFGAMPTPAASLIGLFAGGVSLLLFCCCAIAAWRKRIWNSRVGVICFGTYLYILLLATTTALGRSEAGDPFFIAAKSSRYITVPMVGWAVLMVCAVWLLPQTRLVFLAAILAVGGLSAQSDFVDIGGQDFSELQICSLMLRNKLEDTRILEKIFPNADFVRKELPLLREKKLSIYAHGEDKWLGQELKTLWPIDQPVPGQITQVYPIEGGLEIYGWSDSPYLSDEHSVLFIDESGRIAGFGNRPHAGFPLGAGTSKTPQSMAFVGFIRLQPGMKKFSTYVWTNPQKTLHPMGEPITVPNLSPLQSEHILKTMEGITWQTSNTFHLHGYDSSWKYMAPAGNVYGSFDASTYGELRSGVFPTPATHCVVLPVLHGDSASGQSVTLMDADRNLEIASVPMLNGRFGWEQWRISVPAETSRLFVLAQDKGPAFSEWVAVGAPAQCP